jgi:hypothetical protein
MICLNWRHSYRLRNARALSSIQPLVSGMRSSAGCMAQVRVPTGRLVKVLVLKPRPAKPRPGLGARVQWPVRGRRGEGRRWHWRSVAPAEGDSESTWGACSPAQRDPAAGLYVGKWGFRDRPGEHRERPRVNWHGPRGGAVKTGHWQAPGGK